MYIEKAHKQELYKISYFELLNSWFLKVVKRLSSEIIGNLTKRLGKYIADLFGIMLLFYSINLNVV